MTPWGWSLCIPLCYKEVVYKIIMKKVDKKNWSAQLKGLLNDDIFTLKEEHGEGKSILKHHEQWIFRYQ